MGSPIVFLKMYICYMHKRLPFFRAVPLLFAGSIIFSCQNDLIQNNRINLNSTSPEIKQAIGDAALRASFVMMYCPENPETRTQWEKVYPFFNEKDYGFMMENYGHGGVTNASGLGIGEFTIYDWGNGAAAEAYNRIRDHDSGNVK